MTESNQFILSKRLATVFSSKVEPQVSEDLQLVFAACGNTIRVYSLKTGLQIETLRSSNVQEGRGKSGPDVHKSDIVALTLIKQEQQAEAYEGYYKLFSLCSKGVLAEWDAPTRELLNVSNLNIGEKQGKIKLAFLNHRNFVTFQATSGIFRVFNPVSKKQVGAFTKANYQFGVSHIAVSAESDVIAYSQNKAVTIRDFSFFKQSSGVSQDQIESAESTIRREARITALTISADGQLVAAGDDAGKIYNILTSVQNSKTKKIIQTLHWHASAVSALKYVPNTPYLLSGGQEAVLVMWHLEKQTHTFVSRVGQAIKQLSLSFSYYSLTLADNSLRVARFDNNKVVLHAYNLDLESSLIQNSAEKVLVPSGSALQAVSLSQEHKSVERLEVKPRNYAFSPYQTCSSELIAFALSKDEQRLATVDSLIDAKTGIKVQALKFWHREAADFESFQLKHFVHLNAVDSETVRIAKVGKSFAVQTAKDEVKIWTESEQKWGVEAVIRYQDLDVLQIIPDVRLRVKSKKDEDGESCIAFLHSEGKVSFWQSGSWQLTYSFKLNQPARKVVFEASFRFLAALTETGGVEVWKMRGQDAKHQWDLDFNNVTQIEANTVRENQFYILMGSKPDQPKVQDSLLLFQFSRPQNLVMFWKFQIGVKSIHFNNLNSDKPSYLFIVNNNKEIQRLYSGVSKAALRKSAQESFKASKDVQMTASRQEDSKKKLDFQYIDAVHKQSKNVIQTTKISGIAKDQDVSAVRLENADKALGIGNAGALQDFSTLPAVNFMFDQFSQQMLSKPSKSSNIADIQQELSNLTLESMHVDAQKPVQKVEIDYAWPFEKYFD